MQVVEVAELGAFGVVGGAAGLFVGKHRGHVGAAHFHGGSAGAGHARIAFAEGVVVGQDEDVRRFVALVQRGGHGGQVARVKRHGHGQACGLEHAGAGGVALAHQDHRRARGHAQLVEVALLDQASGPEFLLQAAGLLAGLAPTDDLQAVDVARHVQHRHHHRPLGREAHAVPAHALAVQVLAVTLLGAALPGFGGTLGGAGGIGLAGQFAAALVLGQALAQALALLGADFGLAQLDLRRVVLGTAPNPVAANDQVIAIGQADFVQVIPAAPLAVAVHPAAAQAPYFQAVNQQASAPQLAQHVFVIGGHQ